MNKYDMPIEQWERLQVKSYVAWGAKWRFRKIAHLRALSADAIEMLVDETIRYKEKLREEYRASRTNNSKEIRQGETQHESSTTTSDGGTNEST